MTGGTNGNEELSLKDITFLRAIRDINGSPERYASTEQGVTPATVTAITEATTLSEEAVTYRLDHPRLGKSGLVNVYEAGPPGDDAASLNSAELTEAGERAIAEAEDRDSAVDTEEWDHGEAGSEFDDMQEWEPAEVESGSDAARTGADAAGAPGGAGGAHASAGSATAPPTESPQRATTPDGVAGADDGDDRVAALEARLDRLEARVEGDEEPATDGEADDDLAGEVAALRETTERLESRLGEVLDEVSEIRASEYGALDEKRERQFETAVKSMVAFHQLATEVLDVRVENYEPAAGRADAERVEITRNRIGDALGVGKGGGGGLDAGGGPTLEASDGDEEWPDPEEAAGGRVFGGEDGEPDEPESGGPEAESDAPDSGVYPPIGGDDSAGETADAADADEGAESDAPESGVYPPIGGRDEGADGEGDPDAEKNAGDGEDGTDDGAAGDDTADGAGEEVPDTGIYPPIGADREEPAEDAGLPESVTPDAEPAEGSITETAAAEGHVVDPIRSTTDAAPGDRALRLDTDPERSLSVRRAVTADADEPTPAGDGVWLLDAVDPAIASQLRPANAGGGDDPFPAGEAYARIADEPSGQRATVPGDEESEPASADDDD